jgi:hypothetical protein
VAALLKSLLLISSPCTFSLYPSNCPRAGHIAARRAGWTAGLLRNLVYP